jgi:hypothetical protein
VGPLSGALDPCDHSGIGVFIGRSAQPSLDPTGQNVYAQVARLTGLGAWS